MRDFETLMREHEAAVTRFVRYRVSSKADGDDILQEVWLAAFRKFGSLQSEESFKAWVIGIARNKVNDHFRRQTDTIPIDSLPESELVQSRYGLYERSPVLETLDELSEKDRRILTLYYLEDMPQSSIAELLGVPIGTVKSRLSKARLSFKEKYPYPPKGEKHMSRLPEILPEYSIVPSDKAPFDVKWEELMGWFIVPKANEKLAWGIYDQPSRRGDCFYEMEAAGRAEIHGIEGERIIAREKSFDGKKNTEREFVAQLDDDRCRFLSECHDEDGVRKLTTFLDGDAFMPNWGYGEDNCGNETNLSPKDIIVRNGSAVTCNAALPALDVVGRYTVVIGKKSFDTVLMMTIEEDASIVCEQYLDRDGRTVLWRRFNRDDWAQDMYKKPWSELLPENERLTVNGSTCVHWYDCITDRVL